MAASIDIRKSLDAFTLEVAFEAGRETLGLLGESGCGKSMTLRCIAGIETPDEGKIVVDGVVYFDSAAGINLSAQQRKTALLFQNYLLFPHMTVEQNIAAGIGDATRAERDRAVAEEVSRFALTGLEKRYPLQLSGGQQQRVALARMLAARPGILMLDEPFSALDSHLKGGLEQSLSLLFDRFEGTVLYVSHDIDEAVRLSDRIAVVERGAIRELSASSDLIESPQSVASLKLSGCKNIVSAQAAGDGRIRVAAWNAELEVARPLPARVGKAGVRAFRIERAEGPGVNCFQVRVKHAIDSRFDRTCLLDFAGGEASTEAGSERDGLLSESDLVWRTSKLTVGERGLPCPGDVLWVRIPPEHIYVVAD